MGLNNINRIDVHSHSEYSNIRLLDSINKIPDMLKTANKLGMKGIALTDHECLCGHLKFLKAEKKLKAEGIIPEDFKAILGNEIYLVESRDSVEKYWHYILIAKNNEGHRALRELSSIAWIHSFTSRGMTRVPTEMRELEAIVKKYPNTLIATSSCLGSYLDGQVLKLIEAEKNMDDNLVYTCKKNIDDFIRWNIDLFGADFYIEIAAGRSASQIAFNKRVHSIALAYGLKIVIGSDSHYLTAKERLLHKAYLNSKEGEREVDDFYFDAHMMDNDEAFDNIKDIYSEEDFLSMCAASMEIYDKIEGYNLEHSPIIPHVEVKDYPKNPHFSSKYPVLKSLLESDDTQERYWANQCIEALIAKKLETPEYYERLETEARIIKTIGDKLNNCLYEYFNTFQHYIDLFWECGSVVGPGRGSAVCFLSNYLMGITQLDPIKYNLLHFRFLNEERVELPDIDLDICPEKRELIFKKIREERGDLNLIQVATFGTEGTRSAINSACRGYRSSEYPNGLEVETAQYLSGLIPQERGFLPTINEVIHGDEEKGKKPIQAFIDEVNKYPGLIEIIQGIEGLVCRRGQHASGVMFYNVSPFETNALMRSPNGDLTTQFELHDSDLMGDVKYDILLTSISSKISTCLNLLQENGYIEKELSLRQIYDKYLHPEYMDYDKEELWNNLASGKVMDVFQFNDGVGMAVAKQIKPKSAIQMSLANALMRLQSEKGEERPADRYTRLKNDIQQWYDEVRYDWHLSEDEIKILEPYYLPRCGTPCAQEDLMLICMDKNISNFSLMDANQARKIIGKKLIKQVPELKEKFLKACPNVNFGNYIWKTTMLGQMSYAFNLGHGLAYSFVGIQTLYLATFFPEIYWDCACLIVNAGGAELMESDSEECEDDEKENTKKKNKSVNYGKIGIALGKAKRAGIKILPPDINKSDLIFKPDERKDAIIYGLKGLTRIGTDLVLEIMNNRPYMSITDFIEKNKVNKTQMISLIKSGAFDELYSDRTKAMNEYLNLISEKKKRITLQNMRILSENGLIPEEYDFERRVYNFTKYLRQFKEGKYYLLDNVAMNFFMKNYDTDVLDDVVIDGNSSRGKIVQGIWDKTYEKAMLPLKKWIKENQQTILEQLNNKLYEETKNKYAFGDINKWEMDALGTYCHEHELQNMRTELYGIKNFEEIDEEPEIENEFFAKDGSMIKLYKIFRICGTVIDKDKNKSTVVLLTPSMQVVNVKVWKNQYAKWDRQISRRNPDGTKTIVERSFFARGTKLVITGIRRGDDFVPRKYKNTSHPLFERIDELDGRGHIVASTTERKEED